MSRAEVERLRREADRMLAQAAEIESRPTEPGRGRVNSLVMIEKRFEEGAGNASLAYRYAVVRAKGPSFRWWLTGERSPRHALTWDEVLDFAYERASSVRIWVAGSLTELSDPITRES